MHRRRKDRILKAPYSRKPNDINVLLSSNFHLTSDHKLEFNYEDGRKSGTLLVDSAVLKGVVQFRHERTPLRARDPPIFNLPIFWVELSSLPTFRSTNLHKRTTPPLPTYFFSFWKNHEKLTKEQSDSSFRHSKSSEKIPKEKKSKPFRKRDSPRSDAKDLLLPPPPLQCPRPDSELNWSLGRTLSPPLQDHR
ncbi:hypothetical protein AVEN_97249-1 [Araneus ventricosus]|uniref:Uncharacterized protein n=1 Tax=Araneus ventricosus TaxID=182803 RepID=A0A4Y2JBK5_ARAVE|nr:hypothetical protein AVEN_97249-1 [Araneus ventricosus]